MPRAQALSRRFDASVSTFVQGSLQEFGFLPDHSKNNSLTCLFHHLQHFLIGHPMKTDTIQLQTEEVRGKDMKHQVL